MVIVIDQFAYHYIQKLEKKFTHGFNFLLSHGINYTNVHQPHAVPETATGHTALSTGTNPDMHGIIGNVWQDKNGKVVNCDDDANFPILNTEIDKRYQGKSANNILVDTISDQVALNSSDNQVFAISLKSRAAICTAGKTGKALWVENHGLFTSSTAYFTQLPAWVTEFNQQTAQTYNLQPHKKDTTSADEQTQKTPIEAKQSSTCWTIAYPNNPELYDIAKDQQLPTQLQPPSKDPKKHPYSIFKMTPQANQLELDLAYKCIQTHYKKESDNKMLLWVSLSSLDFLGHQVGPSDLRILDMIYHLDIQLEEFINKLKKEIGIEHTTFILTADHGVSPIPENVQKKGFSGAHRIIDTPLVATLNKLIQEKYAVFPLITTFIPPDFYFNLPLWNILDATIKTSIIDHIKDYLLEQPGIAAAWSAQEVQQMNTEFGSINSFFKHQYYVTRSGQITVRPEPYTFITSYHHGTTHWSPYNYDTHIPLIVYQEETYHHKKISTKIYSTQLANTIAHILNVSQPSASVITMLPGIEKEIIQTSAMPTSD